MLSSRRPVVCEGGIEEPDGAITNVGQRLRRTIRRRCRLSLCEEERSEDEYQMHRRLPGFWKRKPIRRGITAAVDRAAGLAQGLAGPNFVVSTCHPSVMYGLTERTGVERRSRREEATIMRTQDLLRTFALTVYSDGTRWWIVTIFWDAGTSDKPIPAKYLSR
jgi:hypothetical protein